MRTGRIKQEKQMLERVRALMGSVDNPRLQYAVITSLSFYALLDKRFEDARRFETERLEFIQRMQVVSQDESDLYKADFESTYAIQEGDFSRAAAELKRVYELTHKLGHKMASSATARRLGYALILDGDPASAPPYFRESMIDNYALGDCLAVSACLFAYGTLAKKTDDLPRAACLFAAAIKVRTTTGLPNMPWDVDFYQPSLAAVQAQLDQPELAAMWAKGEAKTLDQAMAYALEE
jgi:hypothetical protein